MRDVADEEPARRMCSLPHSGHVWAARSGDALPPTTAMWPHAAQRTIVPSVEGSTPSACVVGLPHLVHGGSDELVIGHILPQNTSKSYIVL